MLLNVLFNKITCLYVLCVNRISCSSVNILTPELMSSTHVLTMRCSINICVFDYSNNEIYNIVYINVLNNIVPILHHFMHSWHVAKNKK